MHICINNGNLLIISDAKNAEAIIAALFILAKTAAELFRCMMACRFVKTLFEISFCGILFLLINWRQPPFNAVEQTSR